MVLYLLAIRMKATSSQNKFSHCPTAATKKKQQETQAVFQKISQIKKQCVFTPKWPLNLPHVLQLTLLRTDILKTHITTSIRINNSTTLLSQCHQFHTTTTFKEKHPPKKSKPRHTCSRPLRTKELCKHTYWYGRVYPPVCFATRQFSKKRQRKTPTTNPRFSPPVHSRVTESTSTVSN